MIILFLKKLINFINKNFSNKKIIINNDNTIIIDNNYILYKVYKKYL